MCPGRSRGAGSTRPVGWDCSCWERREFAEVGKSWSETHEGGRAESCGGEGLGVAQGG